MPTKAELEESNQRLRELLAEARRGASNLETTIREMNAEHERTKQDLMFDVTSLEAKLIGVQQKLDDAREAKHRLYVAGKRMLGAIALTPDEDEDDY